MALIMTQRVLGLKFSLYGQTVFFYCTDPFVQKGDRVFAETENGPGLAHVTCICATVPEGLVPEELSTVTRKVAYDDVHLVEENDTLQAGAFRFCDSRIRERNLDMKLVDVEMLFDRSKILFYFTAPTRIDFRELVKDLVREYHTRIELRQIGVRHETQMLGAIGSCGMVCCCRRFLRKFMPVTIKMAKEQNLFLNPVKISGVCGRLLCCLSYEQENYDAFHRSCPRIGKRYQTDAGAFRILRGNMFQNTVMVLNDSGEEVEYNIDEWNTMHPKRSEATQPQQAAQQAQQAQQAQAPKGKYSDKHGPVAHDGAFLVVSVDADTDGDVDYIDALFDDVLAENEENQTKKA